MTKKTLAELAADMATGSSLAAKMANANPTLKALETFRASSTFKALEASQTSSISRTLEAYRASSASRMLEHSRSSSISKTLDAYRTFKGLDQASGLFKRPTWMSELDQVGKLHGSVLGAGVLKSQGELGKMVDRIAKASVVDFPKIENSLSILTRDAALKHSLRQPLGLQLGSVARANQWASTLAGLSITKLPKLYPGLASSSAIGDVERTARSIVEASDGAAIRASLGLTATLDADLERARLKVSAFAGAADVHGFSASATAAAYGGVFGDWRTHPGLPDRFWRDPQMRRRHYERAEVEPALVETDVAGALEVVVGGGLVGGYRDEDGITAFLSIGTVSLSIHAPTARTDAYQVLGAFEEALRDFISRKLKGRFGPKWFKQRVDGRIGTKAKEGREAAVRRGEGQMPLIHYTDLGDLKTVILQTNNWDEVFGNVFVNRNEFDHDMQKLVATRRPTAHYRRVDGVRLVELFCVMTRLNERMTDDGAWLEGLESDE